MTTAVAPDDPRDLAYDGQVARRFAHFVGEWWRGETAGRAWFLSLALGALVVFNIGLNVAVNQWNRVFFDALERRDGSTLGLAVVAFAGLVVVIAGVGVLIVLTRETLQVRWREWLVDRLTGLWLDRQRYYRLNLAHMEPANPEYRIADESRLSTEPLVDFAIDLLNALLSFAAFIGILWTVGGALSVEFFGTSVTIPAYMTIAALLYGALMSGLTVWVGRPLVPGVAAKNEAEARFRFELTRLRENAESIALIRGEPDERGILARTYDRLVGRWLGVVRLHGRLTWITNASGALIPVVPLLLATPKYLSGDLSLGAVTQLAAAFFQVQVAFAWLVDRYKFVAMWYASARRVIALVEAAEELDESLRKAGGIARLEGGDARIALHHLTIADRAGRVLVRDANLVVAPGEKVLILGESGVGKSTLVRAVAGLWPWGSGRILAPEASRIAFVPPRPYLPLGSLRQALLYPALDLAVDDGAIARVLDACGLGPWSGRLDHVERWDQILSSGERQRLALARLILQKPAIAILDEAICALDDVSQAQLMRLLRSELTGTTLIAVAQRDSAGFVYDRRLRLKPGEAGATLIPEDEVGPVRIIA